MTEYSIGYTVFEHHGNVKVPVLQFKAVKGNLKTGLGLLEKRMNKIGRNKIIVNAAMWTMVYGWSIRILMPL